MSPTTTRDNNRAAVGAVADGDSCRIDLRLEGDLAAMTASIDLHELGP
jgi:hypothetical protein